MIAIRPLVLPGQVVSEEHDTIFMSFAVSQEANLR